MEESEFLRGTRGSVNESQVTQLGGLWLRELSQWSPGQVLPSSGADALV